VRFIYTVLHTVNARQYRNPTPRRDTEDGGDDDGVEEPKAMSSFSSDFDVEIDEDDLRQLDIVEQQAISHLPSTASPSSNLATPSSTVLPGPVSSSDGSRSPSVIRKSNFVPKSPARTLPWPNPPSSLLNLRTIPGQQVKGRSRANEPPTHHSVDHIAAKTWVYPMNVSFRDYQFNIVQRALFDNVLVSLPTGLGKTFIAATVMFNYYRWFPRSKIVFVAPTKPLVAQQVEACFRICGVPYSQTAQLTGTVQKPQRAAAYEERRVFYMTPQTLANDIKSGICDPKSIVCAVIDEAHRSTGNYAFGECVKLIRKKNSSFRVLALSATPGSTVESVQQVISALCIARVEIRTEESLDLRPYVQQRKTDVITLPLGPQIESLRTLHAKIIQFFLDKVSFLNDYRLRDPLTVSAFGVKSAQDSFMGSHIARSNPGLKFQTLMILGIIASLAHAMSLLTFHGIVPFHEKLIDVRSQYEQSKGNPKRELLRNHHFQQLMTELESLVEDPNTVGHPKLERTMTIIMDHLLKMDDQGQDTRIIIFSKFRSSSAEIVKQLKRHEPMVRPTLFIGQSSNAKGTAGMKQKEQIEVSLSLSCD